MASIFKQKYTVAGENGKRVRKQSQSWYIDYKAAGGIRKRVKGFKDKQATAQLAAKLEKESELADAGIVDRFKEHRKRPLREHLEDFENALLADGLTEQHAKTTRKRAEQIFDGCGFCLWNDISASKTQVYIAKLQKSKSMKTCKHYQQAAKQFCFWMVRDQRANESPIAHLKTITVTKDDTEQRRALEPDEIRTLLQYTQTAKKTHGMAGNERALLYRLAVETGLRAFELRSLRVSSFDLGRQIVTVKGKDTKNSKNAILPLREDTTKLFKDFLSCKLPQTPVFNMPHRSSIVKMFRKDLKAVGIDPADSGRGKLDFHGLRHTFGSLLASSGVHPKTAQELMRHSDINLTMSRYTHTFRGQEAKAVEALPDLSRPSQQKRRATGTDGIAYKPAYKKLAKKPYSGCDRSATIGNETNTRRPTIAESMDYGKSLENKQLGNKKTLLSSSDNKAKTQWAGLDSNQRRLTPMGLQPIPFSHSGTDPTRTDQFTRP